MTDLSKLSRSALSAAMRGGTELWGQYGSTDDHVRYAEPVSRYCRRRCHCGCAQKATHRGMTNGVCLTTACQLGIFRWIKTGRVKP